MQYVLVTIRRNPDPQAKNRMLYPASYDANEVEAGKVGPLIYEGRLARGELTSKVLLRASDALAAKLNVDDDVEIVTAAVADAWLAQNVELNAKPDEVVTDPDRLLAIIAKNAAGVALSAEDLEALDPDKAVKGVERAKKTVATIFAK
jgi:hypothetical protein